jgi:hypothetical protein
VKLSFRRVLADSHVAAVAIALLLLWSLDAVFSALWPPLFRALQFAFTAIAILDIPYFSRTFTVADWSMLTIGLAYLYSSVVSLSVAWLLSKCIYGTGPLRALARYRSRLVGSKNA